MVIAEHRTSPISMPRILLRRVRRQCESHLTGGAAIRGKCTTRSSPCRRMYSQVTINGWVLLMTRVQRLSRRALVIIAVAPLLALPAARARAAAPVLTTQPQGVPLLTTAVVDGSSVYPAPQLFDTYRDQVGKPISRESARAVADALTALYERDGFVKPEVTFDDSMTGRGVLRVQVHEARVARVLFEGDTGRYRDALEKIGSRLERARPLRRDDVPQALREMRRIAGMSVTINTRR